MVNVPSDLGERILLATRMAVSAHWEMRLETLQTEIHTRQHGCDSGTAQASVTDDLLSLATHGGAGSIPRRPSRLARFFRRSRR